MARILAIDFGMKRCGLAVTDPLQIIVSGLDTVDTAMLTTYLHEYLRVEKVELIVLGSPKHKDGAPTYLQTHIDALTQFLVKEYPTMRIDYQDESFTSSEAKAIIFNAGIKKKQRQDKALVDKISAVLILQKYLGHI